MYNSDVIHVAAYCRVSTDDKYQLHSLAAQIKYFTEYISQNENWWLKEVYYYDEGILTSTERLWNNSSIMYVLKNDKYIGDLTQWKEFTVDYLTKETRRNNGEVPLVHI
ncbi:MAG: recombinase family protein [Oscillospiraceae bacterium]|nr:recombinase family protein [Oscillospiraceae bacterium]